MAETGNTTQDTKSSHKHLGIIFLTIFIDLVGFSIIFPLFPAMLDYYLPREGADSLLGQFVVWLASITQGGNGSTTFLTHVLFGGILGSLYSILQFVFSPIWGGISDRVGRRKVLLYTIAGTTFSYLLWFFSGSFWLLVISRIISGITSGNLAVATAAVADVTGREKRSSGMALVGVAFGLGFLFGPAIGGFSALIDLTKSYPGLIRWGVNPFSVPALLACLLSLINLIWVAAKFGETLAPENRRQSTGTVSRVAQIFSPSDPQVRRTTLVYFIFILALSGMEFTLTFLAAERLGYAPADNALMFLFIGFILILVQGGIVRRLAPKIGEKPLVLFGFVSGVIAFALLAFALKWPPFYIGLGLLALSAGLCTPTLSSLVSLYSGDDEQGKNLGAFRSAGSLARAFGPLAAAGLYWYFGSQTSYLAGAAVILLPLLLAMPLTRPD